MDLRSKEALVSGATGFIGGRLVSRLVDEVFKVRALVRNPAKAESLISSGVTIVPGDVTNLESIRRAIGECRVIFHCAALMHDGNATVDEFRRVNVEGTRNMLEAASAVGVDRFVHLSSIGVYGISPAKGTKETDPYQPCGLSYCDTKIEAEQVALKYHLERGVPVVIVRPTNVYGPRSSFWTVGLLTMIRSGKLKLIDGGRGMSNHVYVDNLVDAILLAAKNDAAVGEAFIIGDGAKTPWKDFLGRYARLVGQESLPSISKTRAQLLGFMMELASRWTGIPPSLTRAIVGFWTQTGTFDITKARTVLGYQPRVSLDEGMRLTEEWLREAGYLSNESGRATP